MTDAAQKPQRKLPLGWIIRLGVSVAVLAVIFHFVPVAKVWEAARSIPPQVWIGCLLAFLVGHAITAAKWFSLIGPGFTYREAFRAHLAGLFANLFLPSVAGGDVVRAGLLFGKAKDKSALAMGSFADRLLDTLGLVMIAALGLFLVAGKVRPEFSTLILAGLVAMTLGVVGGFALAPAIDRLLVKRPLPGKLGKIAGKIVPAIASLSRRPGLLVGCLVTSLVVQILFVGINIALADAIGVKAPASAWLFGWSTSKIVALLPITVGGIGVREGALVQLMRPFGTNDAMVLAVGFVWQSILYSAGAVGGLVQMFWRPNGAPKAPAPELLQGTVK
ncbi:lysylphosphatidylglycerol synthase transmembrane domain-containing protein [soil metagenome]